MSLLDAFICKHCMEGARKREVVDERERERTVEVVCPCLQGVKMWWRD